MNVFPLNANPSFLSHVFDASAFLSLLAWDSSRDIFDDTWEETGSSTIQNHPRYTPQGQRLWAVSLKVRQCFVFSTTWHRVTEQSVTFCACRHYHISFPWWDAPENAFAFPLWELVLIPLKYNGHQINDSFIIPDTWTWEKSYIDITSKMFLAVICFWRNRTFS